MRAAIFAVVSLLLVSAAAAQALRRPEKCPDAGRKLSSAAGPSNVHHGACAQFALSILDVKVAAPATCVSAFVWHADDVFEHGGALAGYWCDPNAQLVAQKLFGRNENPCPHFPMGPSGTFADALQVLGCQAPVIVAQNASHSAHVVHWASGKKGTHGEVAHGAERGGCRGCVGHPDAMLPAANPAAVAGWFAAFEDMAAGDLPVVARDLWFSAPPLPCLDGCIAHLELEHWSDGEHEVFAYDLVGRVAADGRFALVSTSLFADGENSVPISLDLSYDHRALYVGQIGAHHYSAHAHTRSDFALHLASLAMEALPLVDWARGPLCVPRWSHAQWSQQRTTTSIDGVEVPVLQVTVTYPDTGLLGSRVYDVDVRGKTARPLRFRDLGDGGQVCFEKRFDDYTEIEPGNTRPHRVTCTWFGFGSTEPRRRVTLSVTEARVVAESTVRSWRSAPPANKWYVFE